MLENVCRHTDETSGALVRRTRSTRVHRGAGNHVSHFQAAVGRRGSISGTALGNPSPKACKRIWKAGRAAKDHDTVTFVRPRNKSTTRAIYLPSDYVQQRLQHVVTQMLEGGLELRAVPFLADSMVGRGFAPINAVEDDGQSRSPLCGMWRPLAGEHLRELAHQSTPGLTCE